MRSRAGSPRIRSWQNALSQRSLLAAPPLEKGNEDSGNEIGQVLESPTERRETLGMRLGPGWDRKVLEMCKFKGKFSDMNKER